MGDALPDFQSHEIRICHPTPDELHTIWTNTASSWKDALTLPAYFEESLYMTTVPLARNGGMTNWILVDGASSPDKRRILSSCETFRKRAPISDSQGKISKGIVHGIASVFCPKEYRGRRYPQRMMQELARTLSTWQASEKERCFGSILYSDIGKNYYDKLGWRPNPSNVHIELRPHRQSKSDLVKDVQVADIPGLCERDEALLRQRMSVPNPAIKTRMSIVPDIDHMGWHLGKEEFACKHLFGKIPAAKGAMAGSPGASNVLYILRLVMECDKNYIQQKARLEAVLQAARAEAAEWKLDVIQLWDPSPLIRAMLVETELEYTVVEREETSIASGMWYDEQGNASGDAPMWINNEHYAWC